MAAAYGFADGSQSSPEIRLANAIDRFGVRAVMGRDVLYAREYYAIRVAEDIVDGYKSREQTDNIAAWQSENQRLGNLLFEAQQIYERLNGNREHTDTN